MINAKNLYGLPERGDTFALKTTETTDPYRLYNVDVYPHSTYEPEGLYASIPYITGHAKTHDASVVWMNPSETWVDIFKWQYKSRETRMVDFLSESGKMEFFLIASAAPSDAPKRV